MDINENNYGLYIVLFAFYLLLYMLYKQQNKTRYVFLKKKMAKVFRMHFLSINPTSNAYRMCL